PSTEPSPAPTRSPSSRGDTTAPSSSMVQQLSFSVTQSLSNVNAEQFLADPDNSANFLGAVADELGLSADSLCCLTATDTTRRLSPSAEAGYVRRALQSAGVQLSYVITLVLGDEALDADALYDSTVAQLVSSVSSGNLLSALQAVLSADIVSAVGVEPVTDSSFTSPQVELLPRTPPPTTAPTAAPSGPGSSSAELLSGAVIWGGIAAVVVLLVLAFAALYFHHKNSTGSKVYIKSQKEEVGEGAHEGAYEGAVLDHASP
ncbi:hypothetical protein B484DRAFT_397375, partial [Ochromonadaceae sp. CCMP2298]